MMGIMDSMNGAGEMGTVHSLQMGNNADVSLKGLKRKVLNFEEDE